MSFERWIPKDKQRLFKDIQIKLPVPYHIFLGAIVYEKVLINKILNKILISKTLINLHCLLIKFFLKLITTNIIFHCTLHLTLQS
jgi:hypothetical protein